MLISSAYAQDGGIGSGQGLLSALLPFLLIFLIFYFLLIRPQQKRAKLHGEMVTNLKKGDQVVTSGGITGKIVKASEGSPTIDVEIAKGVTVNIIRTFVTEGRDKDGNLLAPSAQKAK